MRCRVMCLLLLMATLAAGGSAGAQQWTLSLEAGRMRSALEPSDAAASVALALGYDAFDTSFRISAGVPTAAASAMRAAAGLWKRAALRTRGLVAGVDLSGNAFMARERRRTDSPLPPILPEPFASPLRDVADMSGYALAGQLMPVVGYEASGFQLHARVGVSHYSASFGDVRASRTVRLADVQLTLHPTRSLAIAPLVRSHQSADEERVTYGGISAFAAHGMVNAWARVGTWLGHDVDTPWSAGIELRVHDRARLTASARHDSFDPLYLQPPQTSWTVGVSLQVGGARPARPPVPHTYVDGRATIRLPVSESEERPSIAGDFNGWKPAPMQRDGDAWVYVVTLAPGVYNYAFVKQDGTWFVPESVPGRTEDGMGGHVAVLIVQ